MSIVTAGANNFASDWADAINYPGVVRKSQTGEITHYKPAGDTDTERGVALETALGALIDGDTVIISGGTYQMSNGDFYLSGLSDVSIVGIGMPELRHTNTATDVRRSSYEFDNTCSNIHISGISFYAEVLDADYTTNHAYCLVVDCSGSVENCYITLYSTVTTIDTGYSFKSFVHVDESNLRLKGCTLQTFNSVSGMADQFYIGAFHDGGDDYISFEECNFLSQNVATLPWVTTPRSVINCRANSTGVGRTTYINLTAARGTIHPSQASLLDTSFYTDLWTGVAPEKHVLSARVAAGNTGTFTLFEIIQDDVSPLVKNYELKVSGEASTGTYQYFKHWVVRNGTAQEVTTGVDNNQLALTANTSGTADTFTVTGHATITMLANLCVEFIPMDNRATDGTILPRCFLVPYDVLELT